MMWIVEYKSNVFICVFCVVSFSETQIAAGHNYFYRVEETSLTTG